MNAKPSPVTYDWLTQHHVPEVLEIDRASFSTPWTREDIRRHRQTDRCTGQVAIRDFRVAGYAIYGFRDDALHILRFAVAPDMRRAGIGARLAGRMIGTAQASGKVRVTLDVRETNVSGSFFWKACGFRATGVRRDHYPDGRDAFCFEYVIGQEAECMGI